MAFNTSFFILGCYCVCTAPVPEHLVTEKLIQELNKRPAANHNSFPDFVCLKQTEIEYIAKEVLQWRNYLQLFSQDCGDKEECRPLLEKMMKEYAYLEETYTHFFDYLNDPDLPDGQVAEEMCIRNKEFENLGKKVQNLKLDLEEALDECAQDEDCIAHLEPILSEFHYLESLYNTSRIYENVEEEKLAEDEAEKQELISEIENGLFEGVGIAEDTNIDTENVYTESTITEDTSENTNIDTVSTAHSSYGTSTENAENEYANIENMDSENADADNDIFFEEKIEDVHRDCCPGSAEVTNVKQSAEEIEDVHRDCCPDRVDLTDVDQRDVEMIQDDGSVIRKRDTENVQKVDLTDPNHAEVELKTNDGHRYLIEKRDIARLLAEKFNVHLLGDDFTIAGDFPVEVSEKKQYEQPQPWQDGPFDYAVTGEDLEHKTEMSDEKTSDEPPRVGDDFGRWNNTKNNERNATKEIILGLLVGICSLLVLVCGMYYICRKNTGINGNICKI